MNQAETQPQDKQAQARQEILKSLGNRSLVFVGMMGSGKTAIGKITASALGLKFFDSDSEIVSAADLEIAEIFEKYGEDYFRAGEERVIQRLLEDGPKVLSLGGGAFMSPATRKACSEKAISIWLTGDADLLMARVMKRPHTRPMLQTENPRQTLIDLMEKREPIYALAEVHVGSSKHSKTRTRDSVISALSNYLKS